jgi:hypothetical protein
MLTRENGSTPSESSPIVIFLHHKFHMDSLGIERGLQPRNYIYCEVGTPLLCIIYLNVNLQKVKQHYMVRLTKNRTLFLCHLF